MRFRESPIPGAWVIEIEPLSDERGFFARTFDSAEFRARGLATSFPQCSLSFNTRRGTLRGMHFQGEPDAEAKLVRCTLGAVWDVVLDLRRDSPAYRRSFTTELSAEARNTVYVPEGCAHGFITLTDGAEVFYQISRPYQAHASRGVRWNDPAFSIDWPLEPAVISERDANWPTWSDVRS